jgi:hypothetical protein
VTRDQWRKLRTIIIRALLAIVRHLQQQAEEEEPLPRD